MRRITSRRSVVAMAVVGIVAGSTMATASAAVLAEGSRATTITCAFADDAHTQVRCSVANAPRTARLVLERRDGPKGSFKPIDSSHDLAAMLADDDPPILRPTYRVRVEAVRGQVMAQVVLSRY